MSIWMRASRRPSGSFRVYRPTVLDRLTCTSTGAFIRCTGLTSCPNWKPRKSPTNACPFLADSFSRWAFQTYREAMDPEAPQDPDAVPRGEPEDGRAERGA